MCQFKVPVCQLCHLAPFEKLDSSTLFLSCTQKHLPNEVTTDWIKAASMDHHMYKNITYGTSGKLYVVNQVIALFDSLLQHCEGSRQLQEIYIWSYYVHAMFVRWFLSTTQLTSWPKGLLWKFETATTAAVECVKFVSICSSHDACYTLYDIF